MPRQVVPVKIRAHLVPFFLEEFQGTEARYLNKRVKAARIVVSSSLGMFIRLLMEKAGIPLKAERFNMFLSVNDYERSKVYSGTVYKYESGKNSFLRLPEDANLMINCMLENIFRSNFVAYIDGCISADPEVNIIHKIEEFMEKYDLFEFGFDTRTMHRMYYRERKKNTRASLFQNKAGNRALNYC